MAIPSGNFTVIYIHPKNAWCRAILILLKKVGIDGYDWDWLIAKDVFESTHITSTSLEPSAGAYTFTLTNNLHEEKGESK